MAALIHTSTLKWYDLNPISSNIFDIYYLKEALAYFEPYISLMGNKCFP